MKRTSVIFKNPHEIELMQEALPSPRKNEVLIQTRMSAISAGTEMLVFRGQIPSKLPADENIRALNHTFEYPLKYGYASIGEVVAIGPAAPQSLLNQDVFCFNPHESHYTARPDQLVTIPEDIDLLDALFLPNMETAVNFLMDGRPVFGEVVIVIGLGVVGLLTTALLTMLPLKKLITLDIFPVRRNKSLGLGADITLDPNDTNMTETLAAVLKSNNDEKWADLVYELSGDPKALNQAITSAGFGSRIIIGSWYGNKKTELNLGARFHRKRIQLISSQVSTLSPKFTGRWSKERRLKVAWDMIRRLNPASFITHRFNIQQAKDAYELLDTRPQEAVQVILTYDH